MVIKIWFKLQKMNLHPLRTHKTTIHTHIQYSKCIHMSLPISCPQRHTHTHTNILLTVVILPPFHSDAANSQWSHIYPYRTKHFLSYMPSNWKLDSLPHIQFLTCIPHYYNTATCYYLWTLIWNVEVVAAVLLDWLMYKFNCIVAVQNCAMT